MYEYEFNGETFTNNSLYSALYSYWLNKGTMNPRQKVITVAKIIFSDGTYLIITSWDNAHLSNFDTFKYNFINKIDSGYDGKEVYKIYFNYNIASVKFSKKMELIEEQLSVLILKLREYPFKSNGKSFINRDILRVRTFKVTPF